MSFSVLVLECFSLCCSHFTYLFFETLFGLIIVFLTFFIFSCYIFFHTKTCFCIVSVCTVSLFFKKKTVFLVCWPFQKWVLVLCVFSFFLFLTFFFRTLLFFQNKNSVGKTSCVLVYRSLFSFSFICFSCRFLVVFFLITFATCFLLKNDLCNSLFPPFVHPLSICSLSLPLLNFFFFCSLLSPCFFTSNSLCNKKVIFFGFCKKYLFPLLDFLKN